MYSTSMPRESTGSQQTTIHVTLVHPQTDADQDRAVAPPHCWHRLADSSVPSDQSGAHRPMRVCIPKDSSTVWGGLVAAHKAAHGFCMENFDKLPIHTLRPQHLVISIKTSSFESLRRVLSLIHFPRWNAFLIMSFQHSKSSVSHDNFAKTYLFTSYLRSWRPTSRSLLWSPITTRWFRPIFNVGSDIPSVSGLSGDELHTL